MFYLCRFYDGRMDTMMVWSTSGAYTTGMNGANHVPNTSQSQIAARFSSLKRSQPKARRLYAKYFMNLLTGVVAGELYNRGIPRRAAKEAAREKFKTDVMDITVDAKKRLSAFKTFQSGAILFGAVGRMPNAGRGARDINKNSARDV